MGRKPFRKRAYYQSVSSSLRRSHQFQEELRLTKISCIIPAFNAENFLERAVNSLLETRYPGLEIIVVDDGSSDGTWDIAKRLMMSTGSRISALAHSDRKNHGVSASRNLGIVASTGDLVCFLDADDYVLPHRFDVAVPLLESQPDIDAVHEHAKMEFTGDRGTEVFWDSKEMFGIQNPTGTPCSTDMLLKGGCWNPAGILVRKRLLEKTGLFPESYRFAEDYHLWLRMVCVGNVVAGNDQQPVSVYVRHDRNTYAGGISRKVDVLRAMADVYLWVKRIKGREFAASRFHAPIIRYAHFALIRAIEENRHEVGRMILKTLLSRKFYPAFFAPELYPQIIAVLFNRKAPDFQ